MIVNFLEENFANTTEVARSVFASMGIEAIGMPSDKKPISHPYAIFSYYTDAQKGVICPNF
jgi:hypothetical protein